MINGIRHTGIVVNDIDGAINFWSELLGFQIVSNQIEKGEFIDHLLGLEGVTVQTVKLAAENKTMIELLHFRSHSNDKKWNGKPYSKGLTHIALDTPNIAGVTKLLSNFGYQSFSEPETSPDGKFRVCYVQAFEGMLLELVETLHNKNPIDVEE